MIQQITCPKQCGEFMKNIEVIFNNKNYKYNKCGFIDFIEGHTNCKGCNEGIWYAVKYFDKSTNQEKYFETCSKKCGYVANAVQKCGCGGWIIEGVSKKTNKGYYKCTNNDFKDNSKCKFFKNK